MIKSSEVFDISVRIFTLRETLMCTQTCLTSLDFTLISSWSLGSVDDSVYLKMTRNDRFDDFFILFILVINYPFSGQIADKHAAAK